MNCPHLKYFVTGKLQEFESAVLVGYCFVLVLACWQSLTDLLLLARGFGLSIEHLLLLYSYFYCRM